MSDIQEVSLEILKKVTDICDSIGCRYSLAYGTLIGAVRHKGYIPWDDDVDIMLPRPDYEKLLKYLSTLGEDFYPYAVFNRQTNKKYIYGITRICDLRYEIHTDNEDDCGMGIFIDIYPFDGLGNDKIIALDKLVQTSKCLKDIILSTRKRLEIPNRNNWKGKLVYIVKWIIHHILGAEFYYRRQRKVFNNLPDYDESEYVGPLAWYFSKPETVLFKREFFSELIKIQFEKYSFYVPSKFHEVLTNAYGDYMKLPPEEERINHHNYKAYRKR